MILLCIGLVFQDVDLGGEEAIWGEVVIGGKVEEGQRQLRTPNHSHGSECNGLVVVRRFGMSPDREGLVKGSQSAERVSHLLRGQLGLGFVKFGSKS
jgi:hypothetical protein